MGRSELFIHREAVREPVRPLTLLSEYVVNSLPTDLLQVREGSIPVAQLITNAQHLVDTLPDEFIPTDQAHDDLALLDLLYLQHGIIHAGGKAPEKLTRQILIRSQHANRLATLTYEDLIFINPTNDRRTFSAGTLAATERDFYTSHVHMEEQLEVILQTLESVQTMMGTQAEDDARIFALLASTTGPWQRVHEHMRDLVKLMSATEFAGFRDYFIGNTEAGFIGPSGAFSYRVPLVEALLAAEAMKPDQIEFITKNIAYFPRVGQQALLRGLSMAHNKMSLNRLARSAEALPQTQRGLQMIDDALNTFRNIHFSAVRRHQPAVAHGGEAGASGGTKSYLQERIYRHIT